MIDAVLRALGMALAMGWEILWPLILGFALSAAVQAVVSKQQMSQLLPDDQSRSIATHTSLPPCSPPSRTSPSGGRRTRPSLTATARGSRVNARVATEEWLRRGPNQRMPPNRRTT